MIPLNLPQYNLKIKQSEGKSSVLSSYVPSGCFENAGLDTSWQVPQTAAS